MVKNLLETVRSMQWGEKDKDFSEEEAQIVVGWGMPEEATWMVLDRETKFADHLVRIPGLLHHYSISKLTLMGQPKETREQQGKGVFVGMSSE